MKNILILVALISFSASAQLSIPMRTTHIKNLLVFADEVKANAKHVYTQLTVDSAGIQYSHEINMVWKDEQGGSLRVTFRKIMEGESKSLEKSGKPMYYFKMMEGKFLDLFPMWKKYVNTDADAEQIAAKNFATKLYSESEKADWHPSMIKLLPKGNSGTWYLQ